MSRPRAAEQALDEDDDSSGDPSSSEESCDAPVPESSETPQGRQQSGKLRETLAPQPTREDTKTAPEKKKVKSKHKIGMLTKFCKYPVVRRCARRLGFKEVDDDSDDWCLIWMDTAYHLDSVVNMKRFQHVNHFPRMSEICRKDLLGRNLNRMRRAFPKDYDFFPRTWVLPADYIDFMAHAKSNRVYICKPESSCQGKGIRLIRGAKDIKPGDHMVCQVYLTDPFLIDGFKFDMRIYVLITSCDPLRIYIFDEGLARFATVPFEDPSKGNMKDMCMHLTNYAINKRSDTFVRSTDGTTGSKRRLTYIKSFLASHGYNVPQIWGRIEDVVIKTIISAESYLKHNYHSCFPNRVLSSACFEILGYDVILDSSLNPWVLEVNHSPSFTCDSPLDKEIKEAVITDAIRMLDISHRDVQRCKAHERAMMMSRMSATTEARTAEPAPKGPVDWKYPSLDVLERRELKDGYKKIYPVAGQSDKYEMFIAQAPAIYAATATSKARVESARALREQLEEKQSGDIKHQSRASQAQASPASASRPPRIPIARASSVVDDPSAAQPEAGGPPSRRTTFHATGDGRSWVSPSFAEDSTAARGSDPFFALEEKRITSAIERVAKEYDLKPRPPSAASARPAALPSSYQPLSRPSIGAPQARASASAGTSRVLLASVPTAQTHDFFAVTSYQPVSQTTPSALQLSRRSSYTPISSTTSPRLQGARQ